MIKMLKAKYHQGLEMKIPKYYYSTKRVNDYLIALPAGIQIAIHSADK